jgi:dTDP-4-amino-4,6-dideoxygalactose transaminase
MKFAAIYRIAFSGLDIVTPTEARFTRHVYHLYVIRTNHRDLLQQYLTDRGIQTLIHYPIPLHRQKAFSTYAGKTDCAVTEELAAQILSLPLYPQLKPEMLVPIIDAVNDFFTAGVIS